LAYAQHPYSINDEPETLKINEQKEEKKEEKKELEVPIKTRKRKKSGSINLKGVINLNDVTNIIKIGNNDIIKDKYRAPTVHVFALITAQRTWVFACKTSEECTMWHDRISFFLPNQWKINNDNVNVEELLRFHRVKTVGNAEEAQYEKKNKEQNDNNKHLKIKNNSDQTVMSKLFRKVSKVSESLGITEEYSTISGVQPKGTITDYQQMINENK